MYLPDAFRQDDPALLAAAIRSAGLGVLVTLGAEGLVASHVPMLLDPEPAPFGTLLGHLATPNPQARGAAAGVEALAIFTGPDGYITPSWYETKRRTGAVVPTWNYIAVHAYGPVTFFDDAERLRDIVTRLTARHEAGRAAPWAVSDAPAAFIEGMLRGIRGFAIPIARLEGKWKLSQNRPAADRAGVVAGLAAEGAGALAAAVAAAKPD
ncbi:MAG: FMN-binding negative transcriptional regulator [Acetobacteraceae bacterium]